MKAIVNTAPGRLEWLELPEPQPSKGEVRVRTAACGICATDLEMIAGWNRTGFPSTPGHEWAGYVDAVGPGVDADVVGKAVVGDNVLSDGGEVGFEHPGGYAQYLLTEARNLRMLPAGFLMHQAALIEPLAVCERAMARAGNSAVQRALVMGDGPIGLLACALLRRAGAHEVVCCGGRTNRLAVAKTLGAHRARNYHDAGTAAEPGSYDLVVEASGSASGMEAALAACAHDATLLVVGDYGATRASFAWNTLLHRELRVVGSNASAGGWDEAVRAAATGEVALGALVSKVLPAPEFADAVETVKNDRNVVKVVLDWEGAI